MRDLRELLQMLQRWTGNGPRQVTPEMRGPMNPTMKPAPMGGVMVDPASVQTPEPEEPEDVLGALAQVQQMQDLFAPPQQPPMGLTPGTPSGFQPFGPSRRPASRRRGLGGLA
jgi:hypothetical protein